MSGGRRPPHVGLTALFQLMVGRHVRQAFDPVAVFVALLAASFRDVDLSWDRSVLESMHSAVGNALLFGEGRIRKARANAKARGASRG